MGNGRAAQRREDVSTLPDDLTAALAGNRLAQANFERFPASQKKQLIYWITSAKTEKTRQSRIEKTVEMAAANKRLGRSTT